MERVPSLERNHEKEFTEAYRRMLESGLATPAPLHEGVPKVDFLKWLVETKGYLLHGSNDHDIAQLEPRQANCASKEFGNMKAVYAVEDSILPVFYAIKDRNTFFGVGRSGFHEVLEDGVITRTYEFAVSKELLEEKPWSNGVVYILPRDTFVQGHDDNGEPIDEWASAEHVAPVGKVEVSTQDFPYFDAIVPIDEES